MMDLPNRPFPRFPPHLEQRVAAAIRERLERLDGRIGFASAAQGSDILFHEAVDSLDGESHVILPFEEDEFRKESIDGAGVDWYGRFRRVLARAEETVILSQSRMERDPVSFDYANLVVEGLAISRAKELGSRLVPLAVWNGQAGDGPGGTADVIARWRSVGREIEIIDLRALDGDRTASITVPPPRAQIGPRPAQAQDRPRIMALLFGDVAKFSELAERHILPFVEHFLGGIAHLIEAEPSRAPVGRNTWGDGLFLVFDSVRQAGLFALDLCDWVAGMDWEREGLRPGLTLRIGLHAGPVHACVDPLTGLPSFFGTHISRAARIEPITPPGHVYASQAFAALAALDQISEFRCDYVRQVIWAKQYGTFPTYLVRRTFSGADSNPIHSNASGGG